MNHQHHHLRHNNNNNYYYYYFNRHLTYIDENSNEEDEYDFTGLNNTVLSPLCQILWFSILCVLFVGVGIWNTRVTKTSQVFYEWNAIRLILPGLNYILAMDCATLAVDASPNTPVAFQWAIAMYMLTATIAPGIFLSTFVITFLAYRNRSIPFCLVHRGPGRLHPTSGGTTNTITGGGGGIGTSMDEDDEQGQPLVRPTTLVVMMRLFALFCFLVTLIVNFDVVWSPYDLAGRTGWKTVIQEPWNEGMAHIFLSLLPMALVSVACLYFSLLLWRYGSFFSMKIYPSLWNPWISPVIGIVCLMIGQFFFGPDLFPVMSRTGIWIYMVSLLRVMYEVRHDIKHTGDLGQFLDALGDDTITGSMAPVDLSTIGGGGGIGDSIRSLSKNLPSLQ